MKQMEQLRERLNALVAESDELYKGEILKLSQQLDELIYMQYNNDIENNKRTFEYNM